MISLMIFLALQASEPLTMDHAKCITLAAKDFEKSGESSSDVATAVVSFCRSLEPRATSTNVMGKLSVEAQRSTLDSIRTTIRENVIVYIVRYRACKKQAECKLEKIGPVDPSRALEYLASPTK
jgi:hypothetical protein